MLTVVNFDAPMAELPSGTVTFLFTDVEASTRLLRQLGDRYGEALADHSRIVSAAVEEHDGRVIDSQGDAFFVAFRRARDAALAAAAAQRALAEHPWPEGTDLRVRMGLHTGEPSVGGERYHGFGVHRAARIMAAGHGGQVLASQATCSVLEDDELPGIRLLELGEYRLKDLDRPERIFQLDIEGLPQEFPPLRTEDAPTAYTGLEADLEQVARAAVWHRRFWTRGRLIVGVASALGAGALAAVLALVLGGTAEALSRVDANAVGLISPATNRISGQVEVGRTPSHLAFGEEAVWVTNTGDHSVSRIDPLTPAVVQTIPVGSGPSGIAVGGRAVWVANSLDGTVSRIDPVTNGVVDIIDVGNGPVGVAFGAHSVWVANTNDGTISRIAAGSGKVRDLLKIPATELAFGDGTLWASDRAGKSVARIDPGSGRVIQPIAVGNGPSGLAFGKGAMWVANSLDGTASRIDPATNSVTVTIPVGDGPSAVAVGAGGIWVSNEFGGSVARIDPGTNQVVQRVAVGNRPKGVAVANGSVLVTVLQSGAGHRGGTLTMRTSRHFSLHGTASIDTAVSYDSLTWSILNMTGDGLTGFVRTGGSEGTQLVPDLAVSLPAPTDSGRTYSFRLRPNIHYSTGRLVRPSDLRHALERVFELRSPGSGFYQGILGGAGCVKRPSRCDLSRGIVTGADSVTFHLTGPDPDFLHKLALPFAYAVPVGVPAREVGTHPLPATGPYVIASFRPKQLLRLVRNTHFHEWSRAAQPDGYPDEIVLRMGGTADAAVTDVERGEADVFSSAQSAPPSTAKLSEAKTRFASQVHTNPSTATIGFFLNTRVPPFDDVRVRKALNYAADRGAAVQLLGGPDLAQPTCQILPPNFPGYRPYCPYTVDRTPAGAPDLTKAKGLVAASGTRGMPVTAWTNNAFEDFFRGYGAELLRSLRYRPSVKVLSDEDFGMMADSRNRAQVGLLYWIADYPAASNFLNVQLSCGAFRPGTPSNLNAAEFCDRSIDRKIQRALRLQATNPQAAGKLWERIDAQTVDQAPWVPLITPKQVDILSKRVGNYQHSPQWGMLIDQLWVR